MFAPYEHWWPNQDAKFPGNDHVRRRLNAVDPVSKPFINLWYCDRYLRWVAHTWTPDTAYELPVMTGFVYHQKVLTAFRGEDLQNYSQWYEDYALMMARLDLQRLTSNLKKLGAYAKKRR